MNVHVRQGFAYYNGCVKGVPQWRGVKHGNSSYRAGIPIDTARLVVRQLEALGCSDVRMENCSGETVA